MEHLHQNQVGYLFLSHFKFFHVCFNLIRLLFNPTPLLGLLSIQVPGLNILLGTTLFIQYSGVSTLFHSLKHHFPVISSLLSFITSIYDRGLKTDPWHI